MTSKNSKAKREKLPTRGWVRDGFRKRHRLSDQDIEEMTRPENIRAAISIKIPLDILNFFRAAAKTTGKPYQTQINDVLRAYVAEQSSVKGSDAQRAIRAIRLNLDRLSRSVD